LIEVLFFKELNGIIMGTTLYVLRQHPDRISSSLFRAGDTDMDVVFVEQASSIVPSSVKGIAIAAEGIAVELSHPTMTYDDLIEKVFSSEHIIVI
jgi:hypothetical protein